MKALLLTVVVAAGLSGCATDVANRYYGAERYAPVLPDQVEILHAAPQEPFVVIADLQGRHEDEGDLRKQAAEIGADAVIVTPLGGFASRSTQWAGEDPYSDSYSRIVGTAIKYKQPHVAAVTGGGLPTRSEHVAMHTDADVDSTSVDARHRPSKIAKVSEPTPKPKAVALAQPAATPMPAKASSAQAATMPTDSAVAEGSTALERGDYAAALAAWKEPAEQGNPVALNGLGFMYERGFGVPKDLDLALQSYRKAAAHGSYQAALNLGGIYESGEGVTSDPVLAYMWYRVAAAESADSSPLAQSRLDGVSKSMSENDIARAKMLAERCRISNFSECAQ